MAEQEAQLFEKKEPDYKPHLRQSGTITDFKTFEKSLQELRFCKIKLNDAKDKSKRAAALATSEFSSEIELLEKQITDIQGNVDAYLFNNMDEQAALISKIEGVEVEEIHKFKIKFKKEKKNEN